MKMKKETKKGNKKETKKGKNEEIGDMCAPIILDPTEDIENFWVFATGIGNGVEGYEGKWLIFVSRDNVDGVWHKIKDATEKGLLGIRSKVSTIRQSSAYGENSGGKERGHVICVYSKDFRDKDNVKDILNELRNIGITGRLYYKPNNMTYAGIYAHEGPLAKKKGKAGLYCSTDFEYEV